MRTFAVRTRPEPRPQGGFTLVELLVVLAVMGLLAGVAVWRWPAAGDTAREDAAALATRIAAARDQAVIGGRPIVLVVEPSGYRFEERRGAAWSPASERALRDRKWSRGVAPSGFARVRFDNVGLPDRAATFRLRAGEATAEVQLLADGEVRLK